LTSAQRLRFAHALLWLIPALWSSNYIIARAADGVIAPHALAFGRWTLAFVLMLPFAGATLIASFAGWRHEWRQMLVLGGLGMWICGAFVYIGAHTTSATNIGLIYAATPVAIALAGTRLLHEPLSMAQRASMGLALAGVLFVIAKGEPANLLAVRFTIGDGWILVAAVSWVAYTVLLPFTLAAAWFSPGPPLTAKAWGLIVLAGVVPGVLSYQAYAYMLRELGVARASLVMYLSPVYAAFTAWAVLGEAPRWYHAAGAALILPSIYLATRGAAPAQVGARR
jgi:drug/metabolite transporter (DMT)-like permease